MFNLSLFQEVFYQSRIPQLIGSIDLSSLLYNPAFCEFVGYSSAELNSLPMEAISHPDDMRKDARLFGELLEGQRDEYQLEKRYIHKSGDLKTGILTVSRVREKLTGEEFLLGQVLDITEKTQMENTLIHSEKKYRLLAEHSSDIIMLHKVDLTFKYISPSVKTILGFAPKEMIGKSPHDYIHPDDLEKLKKQYKFGFENMSKLFTYRFRRKNGSFVWIESTIKILHDELTGEVNEIVSVSRDIEERINTQNQLRKSEKLAVVGQMAAAVAHEIRNPLTPIKGFMQLLNAEKEINPVYLKIVLDELHHVESIISEFISMSKPHTEKLLRVSIAQLIKQVVHLLQPAVIKRNSKLLMFEDKPATHAIMGDPNSLKQVFINVIENAIEALSEQGRVEVRILTDKTGVTVQVTDDGCGISCDRLTRLGEPFYSTKERGTGLGLMTCYRIIEAHNGKINIESIEEAGTTVTIWLPHEHKN
jgi:two-component system sporulation sensor kinase A